MCAIYEFKSKVAKPGQPIPARSSTGFLTAPWAGFARNEILAWWQRNHGGIEVDLFATRFAERSQVTHKLIWEEMPEGSVIRGLLIPHPAQPIIKVVTRAATEEELARFEHPRMPLIAAPLFGPIPVEIPTIGDQPNPQPTQPTLFD
jgi:hypothetical protein